jgi:phospholipase/lecithinase/hemolysin
MKRLVFMFGLLALFLTSAASARTFDRMVVFGDSLSDTGNLYKYTLHIIPKSPPYYHGHFSNNQVWAEKLAAQYFGKKAGDRLDNYAVGGAGAVLTKKENLPYTLWDEVSAYIHWYGNKHMDTTLHIVWIGANNYLNGPTNVDEVTTHVVNGIKDQLDNLISHHAKMIIVGNLPDLGKTPSAKETHTEALLGELITVHNDKLLKLYNELKAKHPEVTFGYFDAWKEFNDVQKHPELFGLSNVETPCYDGGYFLSALQGPSDESLKEYLEAQVGDNGEKLASDKIAALLGNVQTRTAVKNAYLAKYNRYLQSQDTQCTGDMFWDVVHPTTYVHHYIGKYMDESIRAAGLEPVV